MEAAMKELNRQLSYASPPGINYKKNLVLAEESHGMTSQLYTKSADGAVQTFSSCCESPKSSRSNLKSSRKRSFRGTITTLEFKEEEEEEENEQEPPKKNRLQEEVPEKKKEEDGEVQLFKESHPTNVRVSLSAPASFCLGATSPDLSDLKYSLKTIKRVRSSDLAFRRIDSYHLAERIKTMGASFYDQYILIDCRYPFEYNGGHIKGAVNLFDRDLLHSMFYPSSTEADAHNIRSKKPIFYCEFSSVRGPNMANALRELDRQLNHDRYPYIDYNEIYVLSEGYRHFYKNADAESCCEPPSYIPMKSKEYLNELQKYTFHRKAGAKGLSIRSRSKTVRRCISTFF